MNSLVLRLIAAALGAFYGTFIYQANTHHAQDFSIGHYFVALIFLAYAILGSILRGKWAKPS
tara:strand:- start:276 stop:461 length:186 start_codon:yes stop_codon:yes gene_type:complete